VARSSDPELSATGSRHRLVLPVSPLITPAELPRQLSAVFPNVRLRIHEGGTGFSLDGQSTRLLPLDPHLPRIAGRLGVGASPREILSFHASQDRFDLCFEDSWSAYIISKRLAGRTVPSLVLLHLDDHRDMMPALLAQKDGGLINLATGASFDFHAPDSVAEAIVSGGLGIGSFLTPLYHVYEQVHVRHLRDHPTTNPGVSQVIPTRQRVAFCPAADHIALRWARAEEDKGQVRGTYQGCDRIGPLLQDLPEGTLIVHLDLDGLINDYEGGHWLRPFERAHIDQARHKLQQFCRAVRALDRPVERWVVATSPGFCASRHWEELLDWLGQCLR
jgi:hypothetical protein